jgi:hypothetical protein
VTTKYARFAITMQGEGTGGDEPRQACGPGTAHRQETIPSLTGA